MNDSKLVDLLKCQMDYAWSLVQESIKEIITEEFWWKPSKNAWTLRKVNGKGSIDYDKPNPIPQGPLTIAWLVSHLATCKVMYYEYAFGDKKLKWEDLDLPITMSGILSYQSKSHQLFMKSFQGLTDEDLILERLTNWGELWTIRKIIWTILQHDIYHSGQIQSNRKIFRHTEY